MERATLGGVPGASEVRSRRRSETHVEYRGAFAFRREHEAAIVQLLESREPVEYRGLVEGDRRRMKVIVTDLAPEAGLAYFQAVGEPYDAAGQAS
jgi:hypothetical protein